MTFQQSSPISPIPLSNQSLVQLVVFVLDGSRSMDWSVEKKAKSDLVKDTLKTIIQYFKNEEHWREETHSLGPGENIFVQVITFDTDAVKYFDDFTRILDLSEDEILSPTDKIRKVLNRSNRGTQISVGLEVARDCLQEFVKERELDINRLYRPSIILLSDGCTNKSDREPLLQLSKELVNLCHVFVIEFGESNTKVGTREFHRQSCPEILKKVASPLDPGLLQKIKRVAQKTDSSIKVEHLFQDKRAYIRTLDERHLRVLFITMTTLELAKGRARE